VLKNEGKAVLKHIFSGCYIWCEMPSFIDMGLRKKNVKEMSGSERFAGNGKWRSFIIC